MIDLYYWGTPNGHKITIALEEMGLDYTLYPINILENDQFQPDFLKISPNNKIPAIVDQDGPRGEPISVFESGAILQYLGRKTGLFYPKDEQERVEVEQWLRCYSIYRNDFPLAINCNDHYFSDCFNRYCILVCPKRQ